jgi:hypothetical protein
VLDGSWQGGPDEFNGLTCHVSEARSKTRVFKRLNCSCQGSRIFWCHAVNASTLVLSRSPALTNAAGVKSLRTVAKWLVICPPFVAVARELKHLSARGAPCGESRWRRLAKPATKIPAEYLPPFGRN